jgi:hypothetical protein
VDGKKEPVPYETNPLDHDDGFDEDQWDGDSVEELEEVDTSEERTTDAHDVSPTSEEAQQGYRLGLGAHDESDDPDEGDDE